MRIVPFYDRTRLVDTTLATVAHNMAEGALLVTAVLWLFLRALAGSFAVAVTMPLALCTASSVSIKWEFLPICCQWARWISASCSTARSSSSRTCTVTWPKTVKQADLALSQKAVDRAHKLQADGAISEKDVAQVEADFRKAKADAAGTAAQLSALGISASDPAVVVALRAQVAGRVVERNVLVGQEVRADAPSPLLTISDLGNVWVFADVYEQDLKLVQQGASVDVRVPAYPDEKFPAVVTHVGDVIDPMSHTLKLRCRVPNPGERLKPAARCSSRTKSTISEVGAPA